MRRLLIIIYIVFCSEVGILLFVFPWLSIWNKNYFTDHYPLLSAISHNYFLRGAISGLGLADIWLAIYEIGQLLKPPRNSGSQSSP
jgi:hypothetical protein